MNAFCLSHRLPNIVWCAPHPLTPPGLLSTVIASLCAIQNAVTWGLGGSWCKRLDRVGCHAQMPPHNPPHTRHMRAGLIRQQQNTAGRTQTVREQRRKNLKGKSTAVGTCVHACAHAAELHRRGCLTHVWAASPASPWGRGGCRCLIASACKERAEAPRSTEAHRTGAVDPARPYQFENVWARVARRSKNPDERDGCGAGACERAGRSNTSEGGGLGRASAAPGGRLFAISAPNGHRGWVRRPTDECRGPWGTNVWRRELSAAVRARAGDGALRKTSVCSGQAG